ncbi:hypothetical protein MRB53_040341 [Persea americana]|nr:hypothetical protein MRB53_040341 [Persea americana]
MLVPGNLDFVASKTALRHETKLEAASRADSRAAMRCKEHDIAVDNSISAQGSYCASRIDALSLMGLDEAGSISVGVVDNARCTRHEGAVSVSASLTQLIGRKACGRETSNAIA